MKENCIYLPNLKRVRIINYSLYNDNIDYEFIDGINLIIGGNGVGKTTFINIVKYALIGLYKKDLTVRNYNSEKRFIRGLFTNSNTYFRYRTKENPSDQEGYVELFFNINGTNFVVKRSLYNTELMSASYIEDGISYEIKGIRVRQDSYEKMEGSNKEEKSNYLQYNYEQIVAQKANLADFNDFIFFVNQILLFGETRETVLWSVEAQNRLLSNYLNDPELETKRKDMNFEAKYQDSIARHRQEEIKAITKVIRKLDEEKGIKFNENDKLGLLEKIETLEKSLDTIQRNRNELQRRISSMYKNVSEISSTINIKEKEKEKEESKEDKQFWMGVNPKYNIFKKQMLNNHICPMCNSPIENSYNKYSDELGECFLCHSSIAPNPSLNEHIELIKKEIVMLLGERKKQEKLILNSENEIKKLDNDYRKSKIELFEKQNQLRTFESINEKDDTKNESSYIAMIKRIDELNLEKENALKLCEEYKEKGNEIVKSIEENLINSTKNISSIFTNFAEAFLHIPCHLTFDFTENGKTKIFIPVIDGKMRIDSEELSESQRFFIDYSFRMSILSYFYNGPTFYICETPDSSLDLSYEENAANTFIKYIEQPNSLILTSNLNNSTFIKCLINKTKKLKLLNLLKYGKVSYVQTQHIALQKLSEEIEEIVNGRIFE